MADTWETLCTFHKTWQISRQKVYTFAELGLRNKELSQKYSQHRHRFHLIPSNSSNSVIQYKMSSKTNWQITSVWCRFNALRSKTVATGKSLNNARDCNFEHFKRLTFSSMFCYIKPSFLLKVNTANRQHDHIKPKATTRRWYFAYLEHY